MDPVVVTGASGFVGRALMAAEPAARTLSLSAADWRERLEGTSFAGAVVYHLAARVHRLGDRDAAGYTHDNVVKTVALAHAAARQGARAFVFTSTIKVNGEETREHPFRVEDTPSPQDDYARSKWAAERELANVARETGLAVEIVRPTLVYGPQARGNLGALVRLCDTPCPLPFASLRNRRSFLAVSDLVALLRACAIRAQAGMAETWLAAHPDPASTRELVTLLRRALGRSPRLAAVPAALLEASAALIGRRELGLRLTRSLEVDSERTSRELGWQARVPLAEAMQQIADAYRGGRAP